jgi:hypothetical protein
MLTFNKLKPPGILPKERLKPHIGISILIDLLHHSKASIPNQRIPNTRNPNLMHPLIKSLLPINPRQKGRRVLYFGKGYLTEGKAYLGGGDEMALYEVVVDWGF